MSRRLRRFWDKLEAKQADELSKNFLRGEEFSFLEENSKENIIEEAINQQIEIDLKEEIEPLPLNVHEVSPPTSKLETIFKILEFVPNSTPSNVEFLSTLPIEFLEEVLEDERVKKIEHEKRIRYQLYSELKYNLRLTADTKFYSAESIRLIEAAKRLTIKYNYPKVTTEMLLLAFFFVESPALEMLRKNCFTLESAFNLYEQFKLIEKQKIFYQKIFQIKEIFDNEKRFVFIFKKLAEKKLFKTLFTKYHLSFSEANKFYRKSTSIIKFLVEKTERLHQNFWEYSVLFDQQFEAILERIIPKFYKRKLPEETIISFSDSVTELLNETLIAAIERFQTPTITTDIILLILIEKVLDDLGPLPAGDLFEDRPEINLPMPPIKNLLLITKWFKSIFQENTKMELFLLRYDLLMKVHNVESELRSQISPEQHYFGYLLKTELPELTIKNLLENQTLNTAVIEFRDNLMQLSNKQDMHEQLYKDVLEDLILTSDRSYSSENTVE
jgi:hypothetical protein